MTFCMRCGNHMLRRWIEEDAVERVMCIACGHVHYDSPKVLVWCFAYWQQRIVLCRRAREPARGLWNPPSGFVEAGETLEEAIARELLEEAGLAVEPARFALYRVTSIPHMNEIYIGYRTQLSEEPQLLCGPETSEVGLYGEHDAPLQELAFREMLSDVPQDFFRFMGSGEFPITAETVRVQPGERYTTERGTQ